jgi:hypothetical protein
MMMNLANMLMAKKDALARAYLPKYGHVCTAIQSSVT